MKLDIMEHQYMMNEYFLEAMKIMYRKEFKGKPASMNRVHFSNWLAQRLYDLCFLLDDDSMFDTIDGLIKSASPTLYKKYQKYLEE